MNFAFVLLSEERLPNPKKIARLFDRFATDAEQRLRLRRNEADAKADADVLMFDLSPNGTALVAFVPTAVPNREADHAARFSVSALGAGWELPSHCSSDRDLAGR